MKAGFEDFAEAGAFLFGKAGVAAVGFGIGQIDFLVGHIEVARHQHRFVPLQGLDKSEESGIPGKTVGQAGQFRLGVGRVDADDITTRVFQGDHAAFVVMLREADAVQYRERRMFGEDTGAAVAGFGGAVPEPVIAGEPPEVDGLRVDFGFLEEQEVRLLGVDKIGETLAHDGAEAIDVPGDQFHGPIQARGGRGCKEGVQPGWRFGCRGGACPTRRRKKGSIPWIRQDLDSLRVAAFRKDRGG